MRGKIKNRELQYILFNFCFLKVNFEEDSRVKYLELLGYKKDDLRKKVNVPGSCACVKCFADGCFCRVQPEMFTVWLKYSFTCGTGRAITNIHRLFSTINIFIQHFFQCVSQQVVFVSAAALLVAIIQLLAGASV